MIVDERDPQPLVFSFVFVAVHVFVVVVLVHVDTESRGPVMLVINGCETQGPGRGVVLAECVVVFFGVHIAVVPDGDLSLVTRHAVFR